MPYAFIDEQDVLLENVPIEDRPRLISHASALVANALSLARFSTDADGVPRDAMIRERLRNATAAQILAWQRERVDPGVAEKPTATNVKLGPGSITYADAEATVARRVALRNSLDDLALAWLRPLLAQPAY